MAHSQLLAEARKLKRPCIVCGNVVSLRIVRDIERKKYCSASCRSKNQILEMYRHLKNKVCIKCGSEFYPANFSQRYCGDACRKLANPAKSTTAQYQRLSGNWRLYLSALLARADRREAGLTVDILLRVLEKQQYKCALSGFVLTCDRSLGVKSLTNASIDRVIHGGSYAPQNIRLVCKQANTMRWQLSDEKLLYWCKAIISESKK